MVRKSTAQLKRELEAARRKNQKIQERAAIKRELASFKHKRTKKFFKTTGNVLAATGELGLRAIDRKVAANKKKKR